MITGQNTEIRHDDVVFHVQTEDKGVDNPLVVTLIYVGGRVLAAKQTGYTELLDRGAIEGEIADLMNRQHRTMLAAIRHGRFDEQVRKFLGLTAPSPSPPSGAAPIAEESVEEADTPAEPTLPVAGGNGDADPAVSLDEMVGRYLGAEVPESLRLEIAGEPRPRAGEELDLRVSAIASPSHRPLAGVELRVELVSPLRPADVLCEARTGDEGEAALVFVVPPIDDAMAVLILSATSSLGRAEETLLL